MGARAPCGNAAPPAQHALCSPPPHPHHAGGARQGDKGYYVQPTVFADVPDSAKIADEEIFGPVQVGSWSGGEGG